MRYSFSPRTERKKKRKRSDEIMAAALKQFKRKDA
jgi:hypothetical protein